MRCCFFAFCDFNKDFKILDHLKEIFYDDNRFETLHPNFKKKFTPVRSSSIVLRHYLENAKYRFANPMDRNLDVFIFQIPWEIDLDSSNLEQNLKILLKEKSTLTVSTNSILYLNSKKKRVNF